MLLAQNNKKDNAVLFFYHMHSSLSFVVHLVMSVYVLYRFMTLFLQSFILKGSRIKCVSFSGSKLIRFYLVQWAGSTE